MSVSGAYRASQGYPSVGYLTIVFASDVSAQAAKHLVDEIAGEAISYEAVEAVRCDVAEFSHPELDAFWESALESAE